MHRCRHNVFFDMYVAFFTTRYRYWWFFFFHFSLATCKRFFWHSATAARNNFASPSCVCGVRLFCVRVHGPHTYSHIPHIPYTTSTGVGRRSSAELLSRVGFVTRVVFTPYTAETRVECRPSRFVCEDNIPIVAHSSRQVYRRPRYRVLCCVCHACCSRRTPHKRSSSALRRLVYEDIV